jgi:CRP-like cAMP-binding protein
MTIVAPLRTGNRLLQDLPQNELERLLAHSEYIHLSRGKILHELGEPVRHAYFPVNGMISLLSTTSEGNTIGIATVGNEGMVGVPLILGTDILPYQAVVQISGDALMIDAEAFKKGLTPSGELEDRLLRYVSALFTQITQSAVCNHFHTTEARFCRWLLVSRDWVKTNTLLMTQESISHMLGTSRSGVTKAANHLADADLIRYRRGKITIINREGLENYTCDCYRTVKDQLRRIIPPI